MAKRKPFEKLDVVLPVSGSRHRVSEFHRRYLFDQEGFFDCVKDIREDRVDISDAIFSLTGVKKSHDLIAYNIFREVVEDFLGAQSRTNEGELVSLRTISDSAQIFNSPKKIDAFMHFFLTHIVERDVNGLISSVIYEGSLCIDYYYFLQIVEDYLVEKCGADRALTIQYLVKYFVGYYGMFFMVFVNFKIENMLVSMKIPDMVYVKNMKNKHGKIIPKEYLHAWTPALYENKNGELFYLRQISFSLKMLEKMAYENQRNYDEFLFDTDLFDRAYEHIMKSELEQAYWGKDASDVLKEKRNIDEFSFKYFFRFHEK